jgi:hypothetical protein
VATDDVGGDPPIRRLRRHRAAFGLLDHDFVTEDVLEIAKLPRDDGAGIERLSRSPWNFSGGPG